MSARPVAKDIIPDKACIGVLGQSLAAAPLGVRVVENLRPVASPDKEQSTEGRVHRVDRQPQASTSVLALVPQHPRKRR